MRKAGYQEDHLKAVTTYLAVMVDKLADFNSVQCTWNYIDGERVAHSFSRQTLGMTWDSAEVNPFNDAGGGWTKILGDTAVAIEMLSINETTEPVVQRGSALQLPFADAVMDAVVTDPPYYDNVPYADISDFFFVWLKRTVGHLYPEHFATVGHRRKAKLLLMLSDTAETRKPPTQLMNR